MAKPVNPDTLLALVASWIGERRHDARPVSDPV
jgi:hypothetical protein